jgi:glycosyltransferase involved in cell wall biosynthesis
MPRTLSLIVPVYNACDLARKLSLRIVVLGDVAKESGFELIESIFVDDGSLPPLDNLASGVTILRHTENMGKGRSVRDAALASRGEWVLMSDVDESVPFEEFKRLVKKAKGNVWMICGSRHGRPGVPLKRRLLSKIFVFVVRLFGIGGIKDTQCGFKLFRMDKMREIFETQTIDRFAFDVELIERVRASGGEVAEVSVEWRGNKRSSLKIFRDAPKMLFDLIRFKFTKK